MPRLTLACVLAFTVACDPTSSGSDAPIAPGVDAPIAPGVDAPVAPGVDAPVAPDVDAPIAPGVDGGAATCPRTDHTGEGTFYAADGTGNCSFAASPDFVAAMNNPDWEGSAVCGTCVEVTGPTGTVTARIVDRCPECLRGDLDLSREAFAEIADPILGRVPITWHEVPCAVTGDAVFYVDPGSNPYYLAVQLRNHRHRVVRVERRTAAGTYVDLMRESYNMWIESPVVDAPVSLMHLRATDVYGATIEADVPVSPGAEVMAVGQFPACE